MVGNGVGKKGEGEDVGVGGVKGRGKERGGTGGARFVGAAYAMAAIFSRMT